MPGKIFVSYRRDDVPGDARGVRDALAARFGKASIFMDVDNLLAGQRFDDELAKALAACDVFLAIIGPRWMDLLKTKASGGDRDYVREEIAAALKRNIVVIPVRVGREGSMPALPRPDDLPEDICDLVHYQKQDVAHERFGRDAAELIAAIIGVRRAREPKKAALPQVPWGWVGATAVLAIGWVGAHALLRTKSTASQRRAASLRARSQRSPAAKPRSGSRSRNRSFQPSATSQSRSAMACALSVLE